MLLPVFFSSLLTLAVSKCDLPSTPGVPPFPTTAILKDTTAGNKHIWSCPANHYFYGKFGTDGPLLVYAKRLFCDPSVGIFKSISGEETMLTTATCLQIADANAHSLCTVTITPGNDEYSGLPDRELSKCPTGYKTEKLHYFESLKCKPNGEWDVTLTPGNVVSSGLVPMTCIKQNSTTTTSTTTTTTTTAKTTTTRIAPDVPVTASQLWSVFYYYNYPVGVHAFCADQACMNQIQRNGIGYDLVNGKGLVGKAVAESQMAAVRLSCPTGSQYLRNLGFTRYGNIYVHNFSGTGLKQGWVSLMNGACGAKVAIKRWKSRYTEDYTYDANLDWNTWYQGMVQDGGKVQFYMW